VLAEREQREYERAKAREAAKLAAETRGYTGTRARM
jgi:hypothetical protein